ncbi:hypothetical protein C8Q73DRAFT_119840 [Cubamyces lactineus]|nr:hypothetical protein C8Q73DRAFT_119840 [Cubamyces lactineus]
MAHTIAGINRHLNSFLPIERLPPEILLIIFGHVARLDRTRRQLLKHGRRIEDRRLRIARPALSALLGLTHVCKRWRDIALNAPALWTHIGAWRRRELDAFLARSRSLPLSTHIVTENLADTARVLAQHGGRMVRLDLTVVGEMWRHGLSPALQFEAPLLQCLTIALERDAHAPLEICTTVLFRTRVSNLKALALIHVNDCIPRNHFPHLTHLYLGTFGTLGEQGGDSSAMCELFQLLTNTPALQHLHLMGLFVWGSVDDVPNAVIRAAIAPTPTPIRLPALRSLTYTSGPADFAYRLLRLIELPPRVLVRLDDLTCPPAHEIAVPVAQAIPSSTFLAGLHHAELVAKGRELHIVAEGPEPEPEDGAHYTGLWIQAECWHRSDEWADWLVRFVTTFRPFPGALTTLKLAVVDAVVIPHVLGALPGLVELSVSLWLCSFDDGGGELEAVMTALCDALSERRGQALQCPSLKLLNIRTHDADPQRLYAAGLVEMTALRREAGVPLYSVTVDLDGRHVDDEAECRAALGPIQGNIDGPLVVGVDLQSWAFVRNAMWDVPEAQRWWELPYEEQGEWQGILYDL